MSGVDELTLSRRAFLRRGAVTAMGAGALAGCGSNSSSTTSATSSSTRSTATTTTSTTATSTPAGPPTAAQWSALRRSLAGTLVLPDQAAYAEAKLVYDLRFADARPAAIGYPASSTDVQRLIDFARRHALTPIPRCGGHSYAGYSTGPGLVIDVSAPGRCERRRRDARGSGRARASSISTARWRARGSSCRAGAARASASPGSRSAAVSACSAASTA